MEAILYYASQTDDAPVQHKRCCHGGAVDLVDVTEVDEGVAISPALFSILKLPILVQPLHAIQMRRRDRRHH
eukprot:22068-Eustigmatos_ZCMA.PRE.1